MSIWKDDLPLPMITKSDLDHLVNYDKATIEALEIEAAHWKNLYRVLKHDFEDFCSKMGRIKEAGLKDRQKLQSLEVSHIVSDMEMKYGETEDGEAVYPEQYNRRVVR